MRKKGVVQSRGEQYVSSAHVHMEEIYCPEIEQVVCKSAVLRVDMSHGTKRIARWHALYGQLNISDRPCRRYIHS